MPESNKQSITFVVLLFALLALASQVAGQTPQNPKPAESDDVVRVYSTLVQTDVMVFDKQGRFVNDLKPSDFDLRIDGKPQQVQFFERVTAGTANEEAQLAAARGLSAAPNGKDSARAVPLDRGRTVFFYVDDFHLSPSSLMAARKLLLRFIDRDMGQNDEVAIASASGQVGFLQQLTDNRSVLHAAIDRLSARATSVRDLDRPPMSEYQALQIDRYDRDLLDYFIEETIKNNPGTDRQMAAAIVASRASTLLQQASNITRNSLAGLESLVRSSSKLTGRKLIFLLSDGFFIDHRNSDSADRLRSITDAAARSGVVIYSVDARGLVASLDDISISQPIDPSGRLARSSSGELAASQDALYALAKDTGGRAVFNTNALDVGVANALKETSVYYLLAWRPEQGTQTDKFRHISVTIPGRKDLTVRVRQGFFDVEPAAKTAGTKNRTPAKVVTPELQLRNAITAVYPSSELPLAVNLTYTNIPVKGMKLTALLQLKTESLAFKPDGEKQKAQLAVSGAIFDDKGRAGGSFAENLTITAASLEQGQKAGQEFDYTYEIYLKPGLYQVRMGVRDDSSGKIATSHEWIEIPNLASKKLLMSSLLAGERIKLPNAAANADPNAAVLRAGHSFHRNSFLRFLVFIYNATSTPANSKPDVALQVQILRDQQPVMTAPLRKVPGEGQTQAGELPFAADVSLEGLAAGHYLLQITAIDLVSKSSTTQTMRFEIE
jgi:VWFA-related protein